MKSELKPTVSQNELPSKPLGLGGFNFSRRIAGKYAIFRKIGGLPSLVFLRLSGARAMIRRSEHVPGKTISNFLNFNFNFYFDLIVQMIKSQDNYNFQKLNYFQDKILRQANERFTKTEKRYGENLSILNQYVSNVNTPGFFGRLWGGADLRHDIESGSDSGSTDINNKGKQPNGLRFFKKSASYKKNRISPAEDILSTHSHEIIIVPGESGRAGKNFFADHSNSIIQPVRTVTYSANVTASHHQEKAWNSGNSLSGKDASGAPYYRGFPKNMEVTDISDENMPPGRRDGNNILFTHRLARPSGITLVYSNQTSYPKLNVENTVSKIITIRTQMPTSRYSKNVRAPETEMNYKNFPLEKTKMTKSPSGSNVINRDVKNFLDPATPSTIGSSRRMLTMNNKEDQSSEKSPTITGVHIDDKKVIHQSITETEISYRKTSEDAITGKPFAGSNVKNRDARTFKNPANSPDISFSRRILTSNNKENQSSEKSPTITGVHIDDKKVLHRSITETEISYRKTSEDSITGKPFVGSNVINRDIRTFKNPANSPDIFSRRILTGNNKEDQSPEKSPIMTGVHIDDRNRLQRIKTETEIRYRKSPAQDAKAVEPLVGSNVTNRNVKTANPPNISFSRRTLIQNNEEDQSVEKSPIIKSGYPDNKNVLYRSTTETERYRKNPPEETKTGKNLIGSHLRGMPLKMNLNIGNPLNFGNFQRSSNSGNMFLESNRGIRDMKENGSGLIRQSRMITTLYKDGFDDPGMTGRKNMIISYPGGNILRSNEDMAFSWQDTDLKYPDTGMKTLIGTSTGDIGDSSSELILKKPVIQNTGIDPEIKKTNEKTSSQKINESFIRESFKDRPHQDINRIADTVYRIIEKRISIEKDRRGLF